MKKVSNLMYLKCLCCCKNYTISKLIEINSNLVTIGEDSLSFANIFLDVLLLKIDESKPNYICDECKDQLIQFHMFKRDIVKYNNTQQHINRLEVLYRIESLLRDLPQETLPDIQIQYNEEGSIVIARCYEDEEHLTNEQDTSEILNVEEKIREEELEEEIIEQSEVIENEIEELNTIEEESSKIEMLDEGLVDFVEMQDEVSEKQQKLSNAEKRKKYKYKANTNDSLTNEQLNWIQDQVSLRQITVDGRNIYKCHLCDAQLSKPGIFKKHLRDSHILKSQKEQEERDNKREFKEEINRCRMEVTTSEGIETIWKCERCVRIFKSEIGFKVHLRYNHIQSQVINADFIAKCRRTIDTENGPKNAWQCVDCPKLLFSRDALRCHMKLEHKDTVAALNQSQQQDHNGTKNEDEVTSSNHSVIEILEAKQKHSNSSQSLTCCEECGIRFINKTTKKEKSLEIHQQLHIILRTVSQSYELPKCESCKMMFSNNEDLEHHLINHDINELYPAKGMSFLVAVKYKDSIGTADINDNDAWKCGHCHVYFREETQCIEHQMILHSMQLICPFDYLEFTGIRGLGQFCSHQKNKHPEMFKELSINCSYCYEEFSNVFDKLAHMKSCLMKKYHCDHCTKTFFKKNQLIRHLKIISGDISFICELCSKKCTSTMDLKLHLRKHTNEKSYQCSFPNCLKIFKTPAARSSHMELHSNIQYECTDCKSIFKQRALLQRHLKKVCCKRHLMRNKTK